MGDDDYGDPMEYTVFSGIKRQDFSFRPYQPLSQVRSALTSAGFMNNDDVFLYEDPIRHKKTVFTPRSDEATGVLGTTMKHTTPGAAFPADPAADPPVNHPQVQIISIARDKPSFMGTKPDDGWLRNNTIFGVTCELYRPGDPDKKDLNYQEKLKQVQKIRDNNRGMFRPVLMQNVQSADPNNPMAFQYCIIVQKNAIVEFDISCWGAAGFGYSVTTSMGREICNWLYYTYGSNFARQDTIGIARYKGNSDKPGPSIQIVSNDSLNIASKFDIQYSTFTFKGWSISSWKSSTGQTFSNSTPIPAGVAHAGFDAKAGFPNPSGDSSVPGGSYTDATAMAGPPGLQTIGKFESCVPDGVPTSRAQGLTGSLQVYMLVFETPEDARTVIKVLNHSSMGLTFG